ncbi:putative non-specific serine/threonine protein kinase [Helianthus annuus]|uniref:Non-specific serine/threonine protein kinase n=1 Tax=Helianthus annuus TaxID=4232 RepID=A0A9K3DLN1_HELAN|nr:putative non-specific serine/threonine protein kinase [Helianthus annuus]KAJ0815315.1 putative non-specific serine/threonine protein kinase [Helianthus annuus]
MRITILCWQILVFSGGKPMSALCEHLDSWGTHGYTAPKYLLSGRLVEYANIFAYEVILYELPSGKKVNRLPMIHHEVRTLLILSLDVIYIFPSYK